MCPFGIFVMIIDDDLFLLRVDTPVFPDAGITVFVCCEPLMTKVTSFQRRFRRRDFMTADTPED